MAEMEETIMSIPNAYLNDLMERVVARDPDQPEFLRAVQDVLTSLVPMAEAHPESIAYGAMGSLEVCYNEYYNLRA